MPKKEATVTSSRFHAHEILENHHVLQREAGERGILLGATALLAGLVGCKSLVSGRKRESPEDPLFLTRTPIEVQGPRQPRPSMSPILSRRCRCVPAVAMIEESAHVKQFAPFPSYLPTIPALPPDVK